MSAEWPAVAAPDLGFGFDRSDVDGNDTRPVAPGIETIPVGTRHPAVVVAVKACGCLAGDLCRCACQDTVDRIELACAPVIHLPPFPLRELREAHVTAADLERGAA